MKKERNRFAGEQETDVQTILSRAKRETVRVEQILDDDAHCVRGNVDAAFAAEDVVVDDGVVNLIDGHPVVLKKQGSNYQVVSGFRRIRAIRAIRAIEAVAEVTCRVLDESANLQASVLASRANLEHGATLSNEEKREAFYREYDAREAAGLQLASMREYARLYRVAPRTPQNWLGSRKSSSAEENGGGAAGVQIEHPGTAEGDGDAINDGPPVEAVNTATTPDKPTLRMAARDQEKNPLVNIAAELAGWLAVTDGFLDAARQQPLSAQQWAEVNIKAEELRQLEKDQTRREAI